MAIFYEKSQKSPRGWRLRSQIPTAYGGWMKIPALDLTVASLGGRRGPRISPFWGDSIWGDLILFCETITPPICGEYLSIFTLFGAYPHLDRKPTVSAANTVFFLFLHAF